MSGEPIKTAPPLGGSVRSGSKRILELDALRGIAATIVLLHHINVIYRTEVIAVLSGPWLAAFDFVTAQNKAAVLLFFVLSGYAIGLATKSHQPVDNSSIKSYGVRRARRILPLYYISLVWTALFGIVYSQGSESFSFQTLVGNAIFLQTSAFAKGVWFEPFGLNGPYWSLSYEAFFYVLLPILLVGLNKLGIHGRRNTVIIFTGTAIAIAAFIVNNIAPSPISNFLMCWIVWLIGYVAVFLKPSRQSVLLAAVPFIALQIFVFALSSFAGRHIPSSLSLTLIGTKIGFVFALTAMYPQWTRLQPVIALRKAAVFLFRRIGDGSYALYLLHYPLLLALRKWLDVPLADISWIAAVVGVILFATVFCPYLEDTITRLFKPRRAVETQPAL